MTKKNMRSFTFYMHKQNDLFSSVTRKWWISWWCDALQDILVTFGDIFLEHLEQSKQEIWSWSTSRQLISDPTWTLNFPSSTVDTSMMSSSLLSLSVCPEILSITVFKNECSTCQIFITIYLLSQIFANRDYYNDYYVIPLLWGRKYCPSAVSIRM